MSLIETNIHADYQQDTWTAVMALRELVANAYDAQRRYAAEGRGAARIEYSKRSRKLTITTAGVSVPNRALLFGMSEARDEATSIGQFGEGLPMALLTLAAKRYPVRVLNGDERWLPCIEVSSQFHERVLAIDVRKLPKTRTDFTIEIEQVGSDLWEEVQGLFLPEDAKVAVEVTHDDYGRLRLLAEPKYAGNFYVKGVFIKHFEDMNLGYCVEKFPLNRDRTHVENKHRDDVMYTLVYHLGDLQLLSRISAYESNAISRANSESAAQQLLRQKYGGDEQRVSFVPLDYDDEESIQLLQHHGYTVHRVDNQMLLNQYPEDDSVRRLRMQDLVEKHKRRDTNEQLSLSSPSRKWFALVRYAYEDKILIDDNVWSESAGDYQIVSTSYALSGSVLSDAKVRQRLADFFVGNITLEDAALAARLRNELEEMEEN